MCIIAVCNTRKLSEEEFDNCFTANRDGVGFGWNEGEYVCYKKGMMEKKEAWEAYKQLDVLPHVVHFRLSSCGGVVKDLTHPFICSSTSPIRLQYKGKRPVLFHNGVIASWREMLLDYMIKNKVVLNNPNISDTRWAAIALSTYQAPDSEIKKIINKWSGKYVVITKSKIIVSTGFEKDDNGIVYSNTSYKSWKSTVKKYKGYYDYDNDKSWWHGSTTTNAIATDTGQKQLGFRTDEEKTSDNAVYSGHKRYAFVTDPKDGGTFMMKWDEVVRRMAGIYEQDKVDKT